MAVAPQHPPDNAVFAASPRGGSCVSGHVYFVGNTSKVYFHQYCTGSFAKHMTQATCWLSWPAVRRF